VSFLGFDLHSVKTMIAGIKITPRSGTPEGGPDQPLAAFMRDRFGRR
jgi:hypothetical protein